MNIFFSILTKSYFSLQKTKSNLVLVTPAAKVIGKVLATMLKLQAATNSTVKWITKTAMRTTDHLRTHSQTPRVPPTAMDIILVVYFSLLLIYCFMSKKLLLNVSISNYFAFQDIRSRIVELRNRHVESETVWRNYNSIPFYWSEFSSKFYKPKWEWNLEPSLLQLDVVNCKTNIFHFII